MRSQIAITAVLAALLTACNADSERKQYSADIIRTDFGVPHVQADDWGGLGYGYGYVQAQDNLCVIMEDLVTVAGERARYFGRDGAHVIIPNGSAASNVDSDFFWRFMATDRVVQRLRASSADGVRAGTEGFAAGFSRYVREIRSGQHPGRHQACREAAWLREITDEDMYRRYFRLSLLASSSVFVKDIANTRPPLPGEVVPTTPTELEAFVSELEQQVDDGTLNWELPTVSASNMYALAGDAVGEGEQPLLFGNPHFPWIGTERLYKAHLKIPGEVDVAGVGLYGVPLALIGYNRHFAWSHTVSTAYRFTFHELKLLPGDPTTYIYDGELRQMQAVPVEIEVLEADGSISREQRTLYRSHFGPMIEVTANGAPILPWNGVTAYTLRDANAENDRLMNQFYHWNKATSLDEFKELHGSVLGVPWVNTIATGPNGPVYYGDVTVVPNVPDEKAAACGAQPMARLFERLVPGLPFLDGSDSNCEWDTDPDAPAPGIFGPAKLPTLVRDDWVHNCNDSYWLTNPAQPLTGFARIIGDVESERTLRTRLCIKHVQRRLSGNDGRPGHEFDMPLLQEVVLDGLIYSALLARDDVVAHICSQGSINTDSGPVEISPACTVLGNWSLKTGTGDVGAHIWREFWREVSGIRTSVWATPFDPQDPVNTPRDLRVLNPEVQLALARAVRRIEEAGIALNAPMGELQRSGIHETDIPVVGGEHFEGAFTIANAREKPGPEPSSPEKSLPIDADGYRVTYGNSYIQTVTWEPDGDGFLPVAEGFVTYSQSTDPASPYYRDFTEAYSNTAWHRFPFSEEQVLENAMEHVVLEE